LRESLVLTKGICNQFYFLRPIAGIFPRWAFSIAPVYNRAVRRIFLIAAILSLAAIPVWTQQAAGSANSQVRVNYLNVCSPSVADRQQIAGTLERISAHPKFAEDFEVARGRSTLSGSDLLMQNVDPAAREGPVSDWVRIRRDFPASSSFVSAQYSFSVNQGSVSETLTFRAREAKDVIQVSISDSVSSPAAPAQVARVNTPAERIRIERFGSSSVVLARCPGSDQSQFEPLFSRATELIASYRSALRVASIIPGEIARLPKSNRSLGANREPNVKRK
jgi:hypothetical protein